jgi:hypothetical protein
MGNFNTGALLALGLVVAGLVPVSAMASDIFRCVTEESRFVTDEGKQASYPRDIYAGDVLVADTASGLVRMFGGTYQFSVLQAGSSSNAWRLLRVEHGPAAVATQMLSIQVYRTQTPFIFADGSMTLSGLCSIVK